MGAVCITGGVTGFGVSTLGAVCAGGVAGFGASVLGAAGCAVSGLGAVCTDGVAGFGVSVLGAAGSATVLFAAGVTVVPGFCGFAFTARSPGIVLGTGWLPVIRVPFARWGILVITGAADAPSGIHPKTSNANNPTVSVFATILFIFL